MSLTVHSLRALTKLNPQPHQRYFVLGYFVPGVPYETPEEGAIHGYICALGAFPDERSALAYRQEVESLTKHPGLFVCDAMSWASIASRNQPNRIRQTPGHLDSDMATFYRRKKEQEELQRRLTADFETRLREEADDSHPRGILRNLHEALQAEIKLRKLEEEVRLTRELYECRVQRLRSPETIPPGFEDFALSELGPADAPGYIAALEKLRTLPKTS